MTISTIPEFPALGDAAFNTKAYAYATHMAGTWRTEANALESNVNAKETSTVAAAAAASLSAASAGAAANGTSASTSSVLISEAPGKVFTVAAGKAWVPGMVLHAYYDDANSMLCTVTSYVGTTLTLNCISALGSGTYANWSIFPQTTFRRLPIFSAQTQTRYAASSFEDITPATYSTGLTGAVSMVVFGNSLFLAASSTSQASIATSANGTVWTLRAMPSAAVWRIATDGANKFVASALSATTIAKSTDGITWVSGTSIPAAASSAVGTPAFAGGVCCVFGATTTNFLSSDNAATWSAAQTLPAGQNTSPISIGGLFWFWNTGTTAYTSATGLTGSWTLRTLPVTPVVATIAMQTNGKLAISTAASGAPIYETSDGINWTLVAACTVAPSASIPFLLNGIYVSYSTTLGQTATYANGAWTPRVSTVSLPSNAPSAIAGSVFVSGLASSAGLVVTLDTTAIPKTAIFSS